jgi:hypothetical protein
MCYHQVVDLTGILIFTSRTDKLFPHSDKCLNCQQNYSYIEKQCTSDTYILYCQFSPLKCCLLLKGNVNLVSDPLTYIPTELRGHLKISYQLLLSVLAKSSDYYMNCTLEYPTNRSYTDLSWMKGRAQSFDLNKSTNMMQQFHKFITWRLCVAQHVSGASPPTVRSVQPH